MMASQVCAIAAEESIIANDVIRYCVFAAMALVFVVGAPGTDAHRLARGVPVAHGEATVASYPRLAILLSIEEKFAPIVTPRMKLYILCRNHADLKYQLVFSSPGFSVVRYFLEFQTVHLHIELRIGVLLAVLVQTYVLVAPQLHLIALLNIFQHLICCL